MLHFAGGENCIVGAVEDDANAVIEAIDQLAMGAFSDALDAFKPTFDRVAGAGIVEVLGEIAQSFDDGVQVIFDAGFFHGVAAFAPDFRRDFIALWRGRI